MSSRNRYLSVEDRATAPTIHRVIVSVAKAAAEGKEAAAAVEGKQALEAAGFKVDYLDVRDAETLKALEPGASRLKRVLAAAWLGKTRLIDNVAVPAA
jgi:pantoate--beta-alanine ligase